MDAKPLHILMTDPHLKGGGQVRYVTNLARDLRVLGHTVTIGCRKDSVLVERAEEAGVAALDDFVFRSGLRPGAWTHDLRLARGYIRLAAPDILHASGSQDHWVTALANRSMGHRVCLVRTRHNTYPVHDGISNRILNRNWTDYQIVVCDVVRRQLAQQKAFDGDRMCSIHNGVDAEAYKPNPAAREEIRREFGYETRHVVCGIAARLVPAKGHEFLFRAAALLKDRQPDLRVLVLGEGRLQNDLRALVQTLNIDSMVHWAGFRDDMADCVQAFDIGVQPSIDCDTSSFSLKEQMAAGKPVVASDYGGLVEIVRDGEEGFIVPAGTHEPLAKAIEELVANPELRASMGEAGRRRVLDEFTVQIFARRTVEAYHQAMEIRRKRLRNGAP